MVCPRCGDEDIGVMQTIRNRAFNKDDANRKDLNERSDIRECRCKSCGLSFPVECELRRIPVFCKIRMQMIFVDLATYKREYLPLEGVTVKQMNLGFLDD